MAKEQGDSIQLQITLSEECVDNVQMMGDGIGMDGW